MTKPKDLPATAEDNDTCDICDYRHDKPDLDAIVIECDDGIYRCKKCRGDADYHRHRVTT